MSRTYKKIRHEIQPEECDFVQRRISSIPMFHGLNKEICDEIKHMDLIEALGNVYLNREVIQVICILTANSVHAKRGQ